MGKWIRLPHQQRLLAIEVALLLTAAQAAVHLLPFRFMARLIEARSRRPHNVEQQSDAFVRMVASTILHVNRRLPWSCLCLARALTGKLVLARRGIDSTLHLGVAKRGDTMEAHAWLSCADAIVLGGTEHSRFVPVYASNAAQAYGITACVVHSAAALRTDALTSNL